uniref:Uncharacterized protein n=1 Tax=Ciona savignyi TaxID=51511 RepID=H2YQS2_CIOSA
MESRIVDNRTQPLYHWNWWFEVTSGDKELDARIREEHFKEQSKKNMLNAKRAALASHQQRKDAMAIKRQREQNKKIAKKHIEALNNLQPSDIFKANKDSMVINSLGQRVVYTGQSQIQQRDPSQNMPPVIQAVPTSNPEEIKLAVQRKYHKSLPENINQINNLNSGTT